MIRLDYVSPLPPVRSGIADYSADLLPHLARLVDLRVAALPGEEVDAALRSAYRIIAVSEVGEGGRIPLYQMGNNRHHLPVWETAMERPGVLVLHDLVLHHFLLDRTVGHGEFEPYRDALEREHGSAGRAVALPVRWGAFGQSAQFAFAANRTLLRRQRGVVVHGEWSASVLAEDDPELAVRVVPMGIPLAAGASREQGRAFRLRHGIPQEVPLLGSFGFQTPIKRTEVAIEALAEPGLAHVHLLVGGELSPYSNYGRLAEERGVADRVHVTGFLPFGELAPAIAATDLCVNLRYPSAGETSASLLRILAVGRPVVVSAYADFGDLPDDIAIHVPLGEAEAKALAENLAEKLASPGTLARMGKSAREFIARHHDPAASAKRLVEAVADLARLEPPGDRAPREAAFGPAVFPRFDGEIGVERLEGWAPGERRKLLVSVSNRGRVRWEPSDVEPGGVIFEVQLWQDGRDLRSGRPWLKLAAPVAPGESRELELELRRPLEPSRLLVKPMVSLAEGHRPAGDWEFDRWL